MKERVKVLLLYYWPAKYKPGEVIFLILFSFHLDIVSYVVSTN